MAQINKQSITVGGTRIVGDVSVDGGAVRGEGGAARPTLVVPLTVQMANMPAGETLALCWLRARLARDPRAAPDQMLAPATTALLTHEFPARSFPRGNTDHVVELHFELTAADVETLEKARQLSTSEIFTLHLKMDAVVGGLKTYNQIGAQVESEQVPWETQYGMLSQVLPFWRTDIGATTVTVERSRWVREVLPGLGYEQNRLIEARFPPPLPDHPSAAREWDKARLALDEQRYSDCVSECRDLLVMWQKQLKATTGRPVAAVIAERRGWSEDDARRKFLDNLWAAAIDIVNEPHHPEGKAVAQEFDACDARFMLLLTAALSEYINSG